MRRIALFAAVSVVIINANPASAMSCTDQGSKCLQLATRPEMKAVCMTEIGRCVARCKRGQMWFVGPVTGNQYPVSSCR